MGKGVDKGELVRMQEHRAIAITIDGIATNRGIKRLQVHPDLVGTAGDWGRS